MATKAFKSQKIDEIKAKIEKAQVAVITEYKGLSVEDITKLRREIQKNGGDYMVTKNTLAKIAVKGTEYEALAEKLTGPVALAFGFEDPVSPAKAVVKFIKESKKGAIIWRSFRRQIDDRSRNKSIGRTSFKRRTLRKNAWIYQFTGIRYRWIYQRSYGSTYKSYGSCQRSKSCIIHLQYFKLSRIA